ENQHLASVTILALESIAPTATLANREVVSKLRVARRVGPRKGQPDAAASGGATAPSSSVPPSMTPEPPDPAIRLTLGCQAPRLATLKTFLHGQRQQMPEGMNV